MDVWVAIKYAYDCDNITERLYLNETTKNSCTKTNMVKISLFVIAALTMTVSANLDDFLSDYNGNYGKY